MQLHDKIWNFTEDSNIDLQGFADQLKISKIATKLLLNRGIDNIEDARVFLEPKLCHLHDPFLLKDMDKAVDRINKAIEACENVWVYGSDYIEGITSVAILCRYFMSIDYEVNYYMNDQIKERSEITIDSIDYIKSMGGDLIICADCQVETNEIIDYAYSKNIDIIIIDNMEYKEDAPTAKAVINPRRKESTYPFELLSCFGIALKLLQGLIGDDEFSKQCRIYFDIAALGILTDRVPIIGENRVFAKIGLEVLRGTTNPGLKSLLQILGYNNEYLKVEDIRRAITTLDCLDEKSNGASTIVKLLLSQSDDDAMMICEDLYIDSITNNVKIEKYETPVYEIDMEIDIKDLGFKLIEEINMLEPFGLGNPKPVFSYSKITVESIAYSGENGEDLKLLVQDENRIFDCIGPDLAKTNITLSKHEKLDLVFSLELSTFKDIETIQLNIKDLRRRCEEAYKENSLIYSYYQAFIEKIRKFEYFPREASYKNVKDLRNIKDRARYVADNLESSDSNLILINTVYGLIDLYLLLSDTKKYGLLDSISFNYPAADKKNVVVVNPILTDFDLKEYENIYLYDIPLLEEEVDILSDSDKIIHILYNRDECKPLIEFFKVSIPTRDDLAELYKYLKGGSKDKEIVYQDMIKNLYKMNYAKLRIGLAILSDAELLNFSQHGGSLSLELLPPPKEKIDITATKLYTNICFIRDRFERYTKTAFTIDFNK